MLPEFYRWWAEQMRSLVPERFTPRARYADAVVVRATPSGLSVASRRRGVESEPRALTGLDGLRRLGPSRRAAIVLRLPSSSLLEQSATLPLAAERDVGAVLHHEMDRLTPFNADDLFWNWRLERRDRAGGRLLLRLLLVPKLSVEAALDAAAAAGLRPTALEVASAAGMNHLPLASPDGGAGGRRTTQIAGALCVVLALALCLVPAVRQELAIRRVERQVEAAKPGVALVDGLRRRLAATVSGTDLFAAESARVGNPLRALAAVTAALPDDTYLNSFTLRDRTISLAGRSAAAARLIGTLSADPDLRDPAFDAPVTRISDKTDLFSIRVRLAP